MKKMKVLILGPGEPSVINSGLGIAAHHISEHLQHLAGISLIQPAPEDRAEREKENRQKFSDINVARDIINISTKNFPNPYLDSNKENVLIKKAKVSEIKKALKNFTEKAVTAAQNLDFDLIYAHDWITFEAALKLKELTGKPLVAHLHSLDYDRSSGHTNSWIFELEQKTMQQANAIIAVSDYTAGIIKEHYDINKAPYVIHNGFEPVQKKPAERIFPEKLVLFVGRLTGQKGPGIFMQIAANVHKKLPDTRFVMAGSGEMLKQLIESGAYRSVSGRFHFTGYIEREQLEELFCISDVFCMPSVSEPFGLSAIEAAAFDVPMVLSRQSGASEVLAGALQADYWDVDGFARHIITLLTNVKVKNTVVTLNKQSLELLDWDRTARAVYEVFDQTLN